MDETNDQPLPKKITPGQAVIPLPWERGAFKRDVGFTLAKRFRDGHLQPFYGKGRFVDHIVTVIDTPVSLCGRYTADPTAETTNVICPTCLARWNAAMDKFNREVAEANRQTVDLAVRDLLDMYERRDLDEVHAWLVRNADQDEFREQVTEAMRAYGAPVTPETIFAWAAQWGIKERALKHAQRRGRP